MNTVRMAVIILGLMNLSPAWVGPRQILDEDDLELEAESSTYPALHTVEYDENSYVEWWCFPSQDILKVACLGETRGELTKCDGDCLDDEYWTIAQVNIENRIQRFEWSAPDSGKNCLELSQRWKALLKDSSSACLFAAPWPVREPEHWVVYGIKTDSGRAMAPSYDPYYVEESQSEDSSVGSEVGEESDSE
jgi:hypothetical protein